MCMQTGSCNIYNNNNNNNNNKRILINVTVKSKKLEGHITAM